MRSYQCVDRLTYLQGIDLNDIDLVIQWKVTCDPCMMWQRFGRGARDKSVQAKALLFVESKDLDPVDPPKTTADIRRLGGSTLFSKFAVRPFCCTSKLP